MIFHMIRTSEIQPWLDLGWVDSGRTHLQSWTILIWERSDMAVAPFSAYQAVTSGRKVSHRQAAAASAKHKRWR